VSPHEKEKEKKRRFIKESFSHLIKIPRGNGGCMKIK